MSMTQRLDKMGCFEIGSVGFLRFAPYIFLNPLEIICSHFFILKPRFLNIPPNSFLFIKRSFLLAVLYFIHIMLMAW